MRFEKDKIKVLLPIGNIFERYGHLSMILFINGHFKFNFFIFSLKNFSISRTRKMKEKKLKTAKRYKMIQKSNFLLISRAHVMMSTVLQN